MDATSYQLRRRILSDGKGGASDDGRFKRVGDPGKRTQRNKEGSREKACSHQRIRAQSRKTKKKEEIYRSGPRPEYKKKKSRQTQMFGVRGQ